MGSSPVWHDPSTLAATVDADGADRGAHGRRRHGKLVRADRRGQRQPACDRRGIRVVRLYPDAYALCTVIVEVWRPGSVCFVAVVLLASALLGPAALSVAVRLS